MNSVSSCLPVIYSGLYISLTTHKWKYLFSSSLSPLKHILVLLCFWGTKACIVSWTAGTCERINGLLFCLGGGGSHYLHPKAIFRKDVFSLSWLETSDPHGRICMDPYLKANQGTNILPISPRWGLNCEQEAQMKDKKKRAAGSLINLCGESVHKKRAAHVPAPTDNCAQHTSRRIPAVFNRRASDVIGALYALTRPVLLLSFNRCCLPEAKWCG